LLRAMTLKKLSCLVGLIAFALGTGCSGEGAAESQELPTSVSEQEITLPACRDGRACLGLKFAETLKGKFYENDPDATPAHLFAREREGGGVDFGMALEANAADLKKLIEQPEHQADLKGTVTIGSLRGDLVVAPTDPGGTLRILAVNPSTQVHEFRYEVTFTHRNERYRLLGTKYVLKDSTEQIDPLFDREGLRLLRGTWVGDAYTDTTTIYATLQKGGASVGSGLMRFQTVQSPAAVLSALKFFTSFKVTGAREPGQQALGLIAFHEMVLGEIIRIYEPF
jgi:hypothetical protein